jgi:hypothetical protein
MLRTVKGMQYRRSLAFITELETSARTESKRMTNNTPQLSRMDLANHCAAFPGLSLQISELYCLVIYLNLPGPEMGWNPATATELRTKITRSFE